MPDSVVTSSHVTVSTRDPAAGRWYALLVLGLVYTLNIADRYVVNTLIEPIRREFVLTDLGVGLLTGGAVALFYVTASIPIAILGDRMSRQRLLALCVAFWSCLTLLCGLSRSFWQLFIARVGVGIGEAGATPISQSLLSDKFPAASRSFALTLFTLGGAAGAAAGASAGGILNDEYGWRAALIFFGVLGLPLAAIVRFTIREPVRGQLDDQVITGSPTLLETLRFIGRQRALLHLFAGSSVVTFWSWGLLWWTPTFLLRSHEVSLSASGRALGLIHGIGGVLVTLGTAWSMRAFAQKDPRYQVWFVALMTTLATIPAFFAYWTQSWDICLPMLWLFVPVSYAFSGPSFALAQNLVPATMRSRTCALILFTANVTNLIVSPLLIGTASDHVARHIADPTRALGLVLAVCTFTGFWGAWHYVAAGRYLEADLIRSGAQAASFDATGN
jgi:MFS family permease